MNVLDWKTPGLEITDFSIAYSQQERAFQCLGTGKLDNTEYVLKFPRVFNHLPETDWVGHIIRESIKIDRPDLAEKLLIAALGEPIARRTLALHTQPA